MKYFQTRILEMTQATKRECKMKIMLKLLKEIQEGSQVKTELMPQWKPLSIIERTIILSHQSS